MKKLFTLLLALITSVGTLFADGVKIGDLYYNLNYANLTAEVTYQYFVDYNNYIFPENRNIELTDIGHLTDFKNIVYNYIWTIPYDVYASRFEKIVSGYFPK